MKAVLCLGSNLEEPFLQLEKTVSFLEEKCYITILKKGRAINTKPFGYEEQPDFANQLLKIDTPLSAFELLFFLKKAETELGRTPTFKWGPRLIDIDIVFYEDEIINDTNLQIPHPGIMDREYLLLMLNEMMPDYIHPEHRLSINTIYNNFITSGGTQ